MYTSTSFISKLKEHGGISKANKFLLKSVTLPTTNPKVANHFNTLDYNKSLEDMSYVCEKLFWWLARIDYAINK